MQFSDFHSSFSRFAFFYPDLQVTFKFNVAKYRSSQTSLVSHWAQTKIKCVLKGGLASNGKAEEIVEVLCRVFME